MHAGDCCTTPQQSVMYVYVCWLVILCGVTVASAAEQGGGEGRGGAYVPPYVLYKEGAQVMDLKTYVLVPYGIIKGFPK